MLAMIIKGIFFLILVAGVAMVCTAIYNLIFGEEIGPFDVVAELFAVDDDEETEYVVVD